MFIAAQFTIAKYGKQSKCPSVNEWIKKIWYIYMMEYCTAERKKGLLPFDFVHVSFIVVPVIPSPHCPLPTPP